MNENSCLCPLYIQEQSAAALEQLGNDNVALQTVLDYIDKFLENNNIQSESFDAMKLQMEDYQGLIRVLMDSIEQDAQDHMLLQQSVGSENLVGADILQGKEDAWADIQQDEETIEFYKTQRNANWMNPLYYDYFSWMMLRYESILLIDEQIYRHFQELEEQYDEIEYQTAGLFERSREIRTVVMEGLEELRTTFQTGVYTPNLNSAWRFAIGSRGVRVPLSDVNGNYKQTVVEQYEAIHPDTAQKMYEFLMNDTCKMLTQGDIMNIKYLVYTAEEPYRTLYLEKIGTYEITKLYDSEDEDRENKFFKKERNIVLKYPDAFLADDRGGYTGFFHECGHATDYGVDEYYSREYQYTNPATGETNTLYELMEEDVCNNIREHIRSRGPYLTDEEVEQVLNSLKYGGSEDDLVSDDLKKVREYVVQDYSTELRGTSMEAVCDGYGGITNLNIDARGGGLGHRNKNDEGNYTYWYNEDGQPTYNQCSELWAEYFSHNMAGDEEALAMLREYYPNTSKALDAMTEDMAEQD